MQTSDRRQNTERRRGTIRPRQAWVCCLLSAVCCLFLAGCVRRALTIRTNPPGALVYVNDELKGQSPVTYDFLWYGWHRLTLRKDGFERVDDRQQLRCPVYLWIPFDLAMELMPFQIRDRRTWSYALTPLPTLPSPVPPEIPPQGSAPASQNSQAAETQSSDAAPAPSTMETTHEPR